METKVIAVTGATSGMGYSIADKLSKQGYIVYSLSRTRPELEEIKHINCDVTDVEMVQKAINSIIKFEGRLDVLINNAGIGISGALEYASDNDIRNIIDVNLLGVVNVTKQALPHLRESKGLIINISSLAAEFTLPFQAMYSVTKAGVVALSTALNNEVRPYGVRVCCILPGNFKTAFTRNRIKTENTGSVYYQRETRSVKAMEQVEQAGTPPSVMADKIAKLITKKRPPIALTLGPSKFLRFLYRILPAKFVNYCIYLLYAK